MIHSIITDQVLATIVTVTLVAALADFAAGVLDAIRNRKLSAGEIAQFVSAHILGRVIPIVAIAFVASALSAALAGVDNAPAVLRAAPDAAWAAAWAGVVAYVIETLASLGVHVQGIASPQGAA